MLTNLPHMANDAANKVPFKEEFVRSYLEHAIVRWRSVRDQAEESSIRKLRAVHYIDAYQSVYASLFGETYP